MDRLPVWRTVAASYRFTFANLGALVRLGWAWMAGILVVSLGAQALGGAAPRGWILFAEGVLTGLCQVGFAVAWHCAILADDRPAGFRPPRWGRREFRYFLLGVPWALVFGGLGNLQERVDSWILARQGEAWTLAVLLGGLGAMLLVFLVMSRCILAFPAAALGDSRFGARESWRATRNNGWRLAGGSILAMGFLFPVQFLQEATRDADAMAQAAGKVASVGLEFLGMAVILAFVSFAYEGLGRGSREVEIL